MGMLDGRVVLVTGVGPGLGKEVAAAVLREGGSAVLADLRTEVTETVRAEIDPSGERTLVVPIDLSDDATCVAAVASAVERFGRLDGVAQVAAFDTGFDKLMDKTLDNLQRANDINVGGTLRVARAAVPALEAAGGGSIVVIGSIAAVLPAEDITQTAYGLSKAGLVAATHYLSRELGPRGIRVNDVAPGYKMGPVLQSAFEAWAKEQNTTVEAVQQPVLAKLALRRFPDDADVANAVLFFLSDLAKNVTGQTMYVDAGQILH